jgi:hypothetical protein
MDQIKAAVSELTVEEQALLRAWLEQLEEQRFDDRIERDARSGKLDVHIPSSGSAMAICRRRSRTWPTRILHCSSRTRATPHCGSRKWEITGRPGSAEIIEHLPSK